MRKLLAKILNRITITALLILIQVGYIFLTIFQIVRISPWLSTTFTILSVVIALFIINKDINPAYKIGWITVIGFTPLLGGLLYLFFGSKRPTQKIRGKLSDEHAQTAPLMAQQPGILEALPDRIQSTARYISRTGPYPMWSNTSAEYFSLGDDMYKAMLRELESAEHYIFLEFFIIGSGEMWTSILEILKRKAAQGVDVRVIYDDMGSMGRIPAYYSRELEKYGISAMAFNPFVPLVSVVMNNRDHRKILVVDGHTAFSGGVNLGDEYINKWQRFGHWKDTGLMLRGDAAWNYTVMFLEMWNAFRKTDEDIQQFRPNVHHPQPISTQGFVQPYSDSPLDNESLAENVYLDILSQAKHYVYIFTPYLIVDNELQTALCLAAKRGVDVRIGTPGIPDKKLVYQLTRSYYPPLIKAGVKIFEYTPGFLHAKSFVADDHIAVVGSINLDYRSLYLHFECGCLLVDSPLIQDLKQDCLQTYAVSHPVSMEDCRPGLLGGLVSAVLRVASPLL